MGCASQNSSTNSVGSASSIFGFLVPAASAVETCSPASVLLRRFVCVTAGSELEGGVVVEEEGGGGAADDDEEGDFCELASLSTFCPVVNDDFDEFEEVEESLDEDDGFWREDFGSTAEDVEAPFRDVS